MIELSRVAGLAFVQDGGRPGRMHEGVPPGGALVPDALARANEALGNARGAAAIERFGAMTIAARAAVRVADDEARTWSLAPGETIELAWDGARRARYLAIEGGVDVPVVLGGRGTLIVARLGGLEGRALRTGDVLAPLPRDVHRRAAAPPENVGGLAPRSRDAPVPVRLLPGPDLAAYAPDALAHLASTPRRVSPRSDRTGTRLEGAPIAWSRAAPPARTTPMIAGAIQLPPSGEPIVLGPDHPTTGGYPVIAVVAAADLGRFHAIPLGAEVRFAR